MHQDPQLAHAHCPSYTPPRQSPTMLIHAPSTYGFMSSFPRQDQTGLCMHEPCFTTARSYSPKPSPVRLVRERGEKSLVPMVPASFLPLFLLDSLHSVRQRNLLRCLFIAHHRVHELVPAPSLSRLIIQAPAPLWLTVGPPHQQ